MIDRTTKLRWRRLIRRQKRQVTSIGVQAEENIERLFFRRLNRLTHVRRFVISWVMLLVLLTAGVMVQTRALENYYLSYQPAAGGTYREGMIGAFTNANPIYAAGAVDNTVSRLLFSGLLKYDQKNRLIGDLAEQWTVDDRGVEYTVILKDDLWWHDGQKLTSADVVFTYETIQNPDSKSPLRTSWSGIKIEATDERTIVFTLPNVYSPFPHSLVNGIVPKHLLEKIPANQLRSARFNTIRPVGSGPFQWEAVEVIGATPEDRQERVGLIAFERYHAGEPKLQRYVVHAFRSEELLLRSLEKKELQAASGLNSLPDDFKDRDRLTEHNVPLSGQVSVFLKNSHEVLKDKNVRKALVQAVNHAEIIRGLGYPVIPSRSPLLPIHLGYDKSIQQLPPDVEAAKKILTESGWTLNDDGIREKDGQTLSFRLFAQSTSEYAFVTQKIQTDWREIGVDVEVMLQSAEDLQSTVAFHNYDALLYGIALGLDPDVFPYWHSTQADIRSANRLNFSEYDSEEADEALEAGRTRSDPEIRKVKYEPFLKAWSNDAPALSLYQPRYLYVTRGTVHNFSPKTFNAASDRLSEVHSWMIREQKALKK
jgi:peptide/nickel transport system substrate-binding protein